MPLKIGIHKDILLKNPHISWQDLSQVMKSWTYQEKYLKAVVENTHRYILHEEKNTEIDEITKQATQKNIKALKDKQKMSPDIKSFSRG